jgi:hypothetical protein
MIIEAFSEKIELCIADPFAGAFQAVSSLKSTTNPAHTFLKPLILSLRPLKFSPTHLLE